MSLDKTKVDLKLLRKSDFVAAANKGNEEKAKNNKESAVEVS